MFFKFKRQPTAELDFIIAGAQKAGTTALSDFLESHPKIKMPHKDELHRIIQHCLEKIGEAARGGADCLGNRIAIIDQKLGARASGLLKLLEPHSRAARQPFLPVRVDILVPIGFKRWRYMSDGQLRLELSGKIGRPLQSAQSLWTEIDRTEDLPEAARTGGCAVRNMRAREDRAIGVVQDLARAASVRHATAALESVRIAARTLSSVPGTVLRAFVTPALVALALVICGAAFASVLDVSRPGAWRVVAVGLEHQLVILAIVRLRLGALARALALTGSIRAISSSLRTVRR